MPTISRIIESVELLRFKASGILRLVSIITKEETVSLINKKRLL